MIFSKLFKKKKWQSEKVSERLAAVAELDVNESANKSILHELAFNDGDEKVRRATLEKLNDFALWWQAYKNDASEIIKKLAEKVLVDALTGKGNTPIDAELKTKFVKECTKSQLLEQVVFELDDETLIIDTINKLDKEYLYIKAITNSDLSDSLKQNLIAKFTDVAQLKKLSKKLSGELLSQVETKISAIAEAQEKPVRLEKQVRLLLAQLNALKDKNDFALVNQKQKEIVEQWQQLSTEFDILEQEIVTELNQKYDAITVSLERIQAPIKQAWLEQQAEKELANTQAQNFERLMQDLTHVESQVTQSIADDEEIDQSQINTDINEITHQVVQTELTDSDKAELLTRAESIFNRATRVPQIKAAISKASELLEAFRKLELPTDLASLNAVNPQFKTLRNDWQNNEKEVGIAMPTEIDDAFNALLKQWQPVVSKLEKEQSQLFNQTRKKLSELEGLVRRGKFHSAFGLYTKLTFWMADLNEYYRGQLNRKWEQLEQDVAKLKDLEHSFATPKKQELIADIKKLAETPLADASEQAHRVRMMRSNWQSLGHTATTDEEKAQETALNEEFNAYCEHAFAPCREHYKQLEDERNANYDAKIIVIEQLETLANNLQHAEVQNWREVESLYVKLNKLWRDTGLVDREKVAEVNKRYHAANKTIKQAISVNHNDNAQAKQQLIDKAKQVVEQELELSEKSEQLKALQNKWQKVGFAGRNKDQKLWNEFRAINNPVFEQRDTSKKQQQAEAQQSYEQHAEVFEGLINQLQTVQELAEVRSIVEQADAESGQLKGLPKNLFEKLKKQHQSLNKQADDKISALRQHKEQQVFVELFDAVDAIANGNSADLSNLKPAWQTAINSNNKFDRNELTLKLEIVAGIDSPDADKSQRNAVQMAMMSEKLEQGVEHNQQDLLEQWLGAGIFSVSDIALLNRIKPIFVS
ncbi:MAG: DUF349 domain-containing protein [Gammaproteobacteria bacterium]|nr:DUF349 domain-containing protein [Gammaproteobacteria bacterium]